MGYRTILTLLEGGHVDRSELHVSGLIANRFGAHVDALFVRRDPRSTIPMVSEAMSADVIERVMASVEEENEEHAKATRGDGARPLRHPPPRSRDKRPVGEDGALVRGSGYWALFPIDESHWIGPLNLRLATDRGRRLDVRLSRSLMGPSAQRPVPTGSLESLCWNGGRFDGHREENEEGVCEPSRGTWPIGNPRHTRRSRTGGGSGR
jgi:hypothetical protein